MIRIPFWRRTAPKLEKPTVLTAEQSLRFRVRSLIDAFNGPFGKIVAGLIAEGKSEPAVLQEFFDRWVNPRRNATIADLQRGKDAGELRSETEPELLNDAIFWRDLLPYVIALRSNDTAVRGGIGRRDHPRVSLGKPPKLMEPGPTRIMQLLTPKGRRLPESFEWASRGYR